MSLAGWWLSFARSWWPSYSAELKKHYNRESVTVQAVRIAKCTYLLTEISVRYQTAQGRRPSFRRTRSWKVFHILNSLCNSRYDVFEAKKCDVILSSSDQRPRLYDSSHSPDMKWAITRLASGRNVNVAGKTAHCINYLAYFGLLLVIFIHHKTW